MDIKEAALTVIEDFCNNIVNPDHHRALQEACRDAATQKEEEKSFPVPGYSSAG